ncbi:hypothetical protein AR457_39410 [Streptomyces agglomeratus]|uniref:DUF6153 family protein n=1 Tax=Streptomyces agglomeratus TaxID=285458 RepID=UPI00085262C4|nr:DUF6153 family protein [Streptomyces agglomeratus]OEJ21989.1 hypothetical protein AR457_39410 [Streptomyces agglomeratus]OEJ49642.1 hypothetical protein BGK72_01280 [Streptomyces agglomeratus]OEJ56754.1 hypothetical protein BGM19_00465 [Streptomyces agglomeratus]
MDGQVVRAVKPSGLRSYLLLVLAVLAGLVAMHGLGPAPAPAAAHAATSSHHAPAAGHERATASDAACQDGCVHADNPAGSGGGGHAEHADATCAATGTAGAPVLPAPAVLPGHAEVQAVLAHGVIPGANAYGRAPPSLSELQLLRI